MDPTQTRKPAKVSISGNYRATMLNGYCRVLGVRHQLSGCRRIPAKPLEDGEMVRAWAYNPGGWALRE